MCLCHCPLSCLDLLPPAAAGYASANPLFMKYTPSEGAFVGQLSYGYRSFECFITAVQKIAAGVASARDFDKSLATVHTTLQGTAILHAGRMSLDNGGEEAAARPRRRWRRLPVGRTSSPRHPPPLPLLPPAPCRRAR